MILNIVPRSLTHMHHHLSQLNLLGHLLHMGSKLLLIPSHHNCNLSSPSGEEKNEQSKSIILDSVSHPSQINHVQPNMLKIDQPMFTKLANKSTALSAHYGLQSLKPGHTKILTSALHTTSIRSNLLSVHDFATRYGHVHFTSNAAHIIDSNSSPPQLISRAPWLEANLAYCIAKPSPRATEKEAKSRVITYHSLIKPSFPLHPIKNAIMSIHFYLLFTSHHSPIKFTK